MFVKGCNGNELNAEVSAHEFKELIVKGSSAAQKQDNVFKSTRVVSKVEEVECGEAQSTIVLKYVF